MAASSSLWNPGEASVCVSTIPDLHLPAHARVDGVWNNLEWGIRAGGEEQGGIPWMHSPGVPGELGKANVGLAVSMRTQECSLHH